MLTFLLAAAATTLAAPPKPVIRSFSDLPDKTILLPKPPSVAFLEDAFLVETVPTLRRQAEQILKDYSIEDPVISQRLRLGLAAVAILQRRPADARGLIAAQRAVETKPQLRAIGFLLGDAIAAGNAEPIMADRCAVAAQTVTSSLDAAAPEIVYEEALVRYARIQVVSPSYHAGTGGSILDPVFKARGGLALMQGLQLAIWRMEAMSLPPCRAPIGAALSAWLNVPGHRPSNIWPGREPSPDIFVNASPVTVAVWDSGFDTNLFAGQLAIDAAEPLDGRDNDGNGVIDDVIGPTFDYRLLPTRFALPPPSAFLAPRLGLQLAIQKGGRDLSYGLDTPEARFFAQRGREASTAEQAEDVDGNNEVGARGHGTSVASIIARDAPWVRLYNVYALPFGELPRRMPFSEPEVARWVALMPGLGKRMRGAGVRIVNMSWGADAAEFADILLEAGLEKDQARAKVRGEAMYRQVATALKELIESSPDILFVTGAGNSNQAADIFASVPQSFRLPNLIVVGATATSGRPTAFTTFGDSVGIYALGENIPITAPGGMILRGQGTSYAAPYVVHAAAAMLAVNPKITPAKVIEGLIATATPGEDRLRLLHAARAVAWARQP